MGSGASEDPGTDPWGLGQQRIQVQIRWVWGNRGSRYRSVGSEATEDLGTDPLGLGQQRIQVQIRGVWGNIDSLT